MAARSANRNGHVSAACDWETNFNCNGIRAEKCHRLKSVLWRDYYVHNDISVRIRSYDLIV